VIQNVSLPKRVEPVEYHQYSVLSWPKIALMKVFCEKGQGHDAKSSCPVKHFVFFD
jgi:hypothetical protein